MGAKLTIRDWQQDDMARLVEIHRKMEVGYQLPETFTPLYFIRKAVVDESGQVIGACAVKLVGEAFLWIDPEISTLKRAKCVSVLNKECSQVASATGLDEISAWIPDHIAKCFARVIEKLGWRKSPWSNWSVSLK